MKSRIIFRDLLFAVLLSFTVSSLVYFGFGNIYSSKILNFIDFERQFNSGIYQYRLLSGWLLLPLYSFLGHVSLDYDFFNFQFQNTSTEPRFYFSLYLLNTFFTVCTAVLTVFLTHCKEFIAGSSERIFTIATVSLVIPLSQFVIVPYDSSSYFFLLLSLLLLLIYLRHQKFSILILLGLVIILSTLNRESAALSLSMSAALLVRKFGLNTKFYRPIAFLTAAFLLTYFSVRFLGNSFQTNDGNLLIQNISQPKNWFGILFWAVFAWFTLLVANNSENKKDILRFHIFSLPYMAMCFYAGILYEVRLYVPLFIISLIMAKLQLFPLHRSAAHT